MKPARLVASTPVESPTEGSGVRGGRPQPGSALKHPERVSGWG